MARQEIQLSTSSGIVRGTTRQDVILEKNWKNSHGIIALRDGKKVFNIQYNDISRITGTLWLLTDIDSKTIKNNQNQVSFYQRTLPDEHVYAEIDKLKWTIIGEFDFNNNRYFVLAYDMKKTALV